MLKKEQFKRLVIFLMALVILGIETALYGKIWFTYYVDNGLIFFFRRGNWAVLALYLVLLLTFSLIFGGFKVGYARLMDILLSQILSILIVNGITYLQLALIGHFRFLTHIFPMLVLTILELIVIVIWSMLSRYIYVHLYPPHQMLLIYGERGYDELVNKIKHRSDKYNVLEVVSILDKSVDEIKKLIDTYEAVILCDIPSGIRNVFLKHCFNSSIRCYLTPKLSDIIVSNATSIHLFDTPLKLSRNSGLNAEQQLGKRLLDIIVSLVMLILASPILLISAIVIKCYDGGPILYSQERLTKDGKIFRILKFRSMREDSEVNGARLAQKDDDRITPYGRFLRRFHLDELPQIFNILIGEMSVVGPRPERAEIQEEYEKIIPEFAFRLKVKAGLTGYAQVYGKYNTTPYDKLKLDMTYIEGYSLLMDLKLILLTVKVLFSKENTEGVDSNQRTAVQNKD